MRVFEHQDAARARSRRLVILFSLAVAATVLAVHLGLSLAWRACDLPREDGFPRVFLGVNVGLTLLLILGGWWIETSNLKASGGAERMARRMGAREARPSASAAEQRLCNVVDEVCIAAHMPRPRLMVLPRHMAINAFAAGWGEEDAVLAVTQGALELLTRDELQGMLAHECSHIHEGDTRLNMQLAGMVFGLEMVWGFGNAVRERGGPNIALGSAIMAAGWIGWLAGRWLQAAVSREREFLADARAVQWTRNRDGLGGVLRKALTQHRHAATLPRDPPLPHNMAHLLLVGSLTDAGRSFPAHPPLVQRIRRIYGRAMGPLPLGAQAAAPANWP